MGGVLVGQAARLLPHRHRPDVQLLDLINAANAQTCLLGNGQAVRKAGTVEAGHQIHLHGISATWYRIDRFSNHKPE